MFRQLRPVSDLQRAVGFDDYDLTANRNGTFSNRQRWRFIAERFAEHLLGAITFSFIVAWIANTVRYSPPLDVIGLAALVIFGVALLLFAWNIRPAFRKSVIAFKGTLNKDRGIAASGYPLEQIAVGAAHFFVPYHISDVFDEDAVYQAYYLERKPFVGGNHLLAVEFIERAPDDDYDE